MGKQVSWCYLRITGVLKPCCIYGAYDVKPSFYKYVFLAQYPTCLLWNILKNIQNRQPPWDVSCSCALSSRLGVDSQSLMLHTEMLSPSFLPLSQSGFVRGHGPFHFGSLLWNTINTQWFCLILHCCLSKCRVPSIFQGPFSTLFDLPLALHII